MQSRGGIVFDAIDLVCAFMDAQTFWPTCIGRRA